MKDVLLVFASPKAQGNYINRLPPLGILYLAAYLEKKGYSIDMVDCTIRKFLISEAQGYRFVGFSINIANVENSVVLIKAIGTLYPKINLIIGGPLPSVAPEIFFSLPIKAIFVSEAEESLLAYLRNPDSADNKGYYLKDRDSKWYFNGFYPYIENLDSLPFPAFDKIDISKYYTPVKRNTPVSILISSRGCPFSCIFCCKILGDKFRTRSPQNVVDEIAWQVNTLGVKEIAIYDDNFTLNNERVNNICDLLYEKNLRVTLQLTNGVRADTLSFGLLQKMKKAGFWMIALAPETGNEVTLKRIKKEFDLAQIEKCIIWCRKLGLKIWAFFMVGFPWENASMFKRTINFASTLDADIIHFSHLVPLPGTELYMQIFRNKAAWPLQDVNLFVDAGNLNEQSFWREKRGLTAQAYRAVYLRNPTKLLKLISTFSAKDLCSLAWYALRGRNII